mmetsp:Transcript_73233/g.174533  ORF Transcript_73233/g.174533 Transcript_73233/m.174533 type:complete len:345 (+) Transcript_73233:134-1168(+)
MPSGSFVDNFAAWLAPQRSASGVHSRRTEATATTSDALFAYMDQMRLAMRALGEELTALEERQIGFDRRLTEVDGLVLELKEGVYTHSIDLEKCKEQGQKLEKSQRTLAKSTQRALQEAVAVQQQFEEVQLEEEFQQAFGAGGAAARFPSLAFAGGGGGGGAFSQAFPLSQPMSMELPGADVVSNMIQALETRFDRSIYDVTKRVDAVLQEKERHVADVRQMKREMPDLIERVEQLGAQCEHHFAKVQEYSVHFSFFRTSFEAHRQQVLEAMVQLQKQGSGGSRSDTERLDGASSFGAQAPEDDAETASRAEGFESSRLGQAHFAAAPLHQRGSFSEERLQILG